MNVGVLQERLAKLAPGAFPVCMTLNSQFDVLKYTWIIFLNVNTVSRYFGCQDRGKGLGQGNLGVGLFLT